MTHDLNKSKLEKVLKIDLVTCPNCGAETEQERDWSDPLLIIKNYCNECDHLWAALSPQEEAKVMLTFQTSDRIADLLGTYEPTEDLLLLSPSERDKVLRERQNAHFQEAFKEIIMHHLEIFITTHT